MLQLQQSQQKLYCWAMVLMVAILIILVCSQMLPTFDNDGFDFTAIKNPDAEVTSFVVASRTKFPVSVQEEEPKETEQDEYEFYTRTWPSLRERMCPNMTPDTGLGQKLFDMAWDELSIHGDHDDKHEYDNARKRKRDEHTRATSNSLANTFFNGDYWGAVTYKERSRPALVYVVIWKSASSFLHDTIRGLAESRNKQEQEGRIKGPSNSTTSNTTTHINATKPDVAKFNNDSEIEDVVQMLPDACFVTAIRDPISHFLSAYNEIEYRNLEWYDDWTASKYARKANHGKKKKNTKVKGGISRDRWYGDFPKASNKRFTQFLINILQGRTEEQMTRLPLDMWHVYPQSRILSRLADLDFFKNQNKIFYINTTHNIQSKFKLFAQQSCPDSFSSRSGDLRKELKNSEKGEKKILLGQRESSEDKAGFYNAAKSVWKSKGPTARALCVLHSMDYACFRQLDFYAGIPEFCRRVYANPRFWKPILAANYSSSA